MPSRFQYVDRTERILVNSDFRAPARFALPAFEGTAVSGASGASVTVLAISDTTSSQDRTAVSAWHARVELHARGGEIHERLLQRRVNRGELVQADRVLVGKVTDLGH